MLAVCGGDLWLMSTPAGKRGFFYEEWTHGGDQWTRISVNGADCSRIPPKFLDEERAAIGDRWFRQEYCCEFVDADESLFDSDLIRAAFTDEVKPLVLRAGNGARPSKPSVSSLLALTWGRSRITPLCAFSKERS
jgi:hypothetical protein